MSRPAFPDHPMTPAEFRANTKMLDGISTYRIKEQCSHTRYYEIEAKSEEEAWQIFEDGDVPYTDDQDDYCADAEIESVT